MPCLAFPSSSLASSSRHVDVFCCGFCPAVSCSYTKVSSAILQTPADPVNTSFWEYWYPSIAVLNPNGILSHLYLLAGVHHLERQLLSFFSVLCQYLALGSTPENILLFSKPCCCCRHFKWIHPSGLNPRACAKAKLACLLNGYHVSYPSLGALLLWHCDFFPFALLLLQFLLLLHNCFARHWMAITRSGFNLEFLHLSFYLGLWTHPETWGSKCYLGIPLRTNFPTHKQ